MWRHSQEIDMIGHNFVIYASYMVSYVGSKGSQGFKALSNRVKYGALAWLVGEGR
jgi:hypothetical protein